MYSIKYSSGLFIICIIWSSFRPTFVSVEVDFHCGVSTGIKDLPGVDLNDGHGAKPGDEKQFKVRRSTFSYSQHSKTERTDLNEATEPLLRSSPAAAAHKSPDLPESLGALKGELPP